MPVKFIACSLLLLSMTQPAAAQLPHHLSGYEKRWACFHPFAALRVRRIAGLALPFYSGLNKTGNLDQYASGGKQDAYRHTFFMAAFAQRVSPRKLRKLGEAHEKGNYRQFLKQKREEGEVPDSLGCLMDLYNNALGIRLGKENKQLSMSALSDTIIAHIHQGDAFVLKRNGSGAYLDCEGRTIDPLVWKGHWAVPKCLVKSNE